MFIVLRRIERWLHQHIFKVGWLITQDFQTTTILYYTFFLPGVLLHEVIYWLSAGAVNVRAEHSLQWPEEQKVGKLELNFVQLHPQASRYRKALIGLFPLIAGLVLLWLISQNIFQITDVMQTMSSGELTDVVTGIQEFTGVPDFWLWLYLVFAIGNTMFPTDTRYGKEWRRFGLVIGGVSVALLLVGFGTEIFEALFPTLQNLVSVLQLACLLVIGADVVMVLLLGTIEYVLERVTDRSATFKNGKMYTMSREEAVAERQRQKELAERRQRRRERRRERETETGLRTVYELQFPVPGKPGDVPVTKPEIPIQTEAATADETASTAEQQGIADRVRIPQQPSLMPGMPDDQADDTPAAAAPDDTAEQLPPPEDMVVPSRTSEPEEAPTPAADTPPDAPDKDAISSVPPSVPPPEDAPLPDTPAAEKTTSTDTSTTDDTDTATESSEDTDSAIGTSDDIPEQTPAAKRFGNSRFKRPESTADEQPKEKADSTEDTPPAKRFGTITPDKDSTDTQPDNTQTPNRPAARRFSISPFDASKPDDSDSTDDDTRQSEKSAPRNTPFRTRSVSPFSRMNRPSVDEPDTDTDDSDEDESIMRRSRPRSR